MSKQKSLMSEFDDTLTHLALSKHAFLQAYTKWLEERVLELRVTLMWAETEVEDLSLKDKKAEGHTGVEIVRAPRELLEAADRAYEKERS